MINSCSTSQASNIFTTLSGSPWKSGALKPMPDHSPKMLRWFVLDLESPQPLPRLSLVDFPAFASRREVFVTLARGQDYLAVLPFVDPELGPLN